MKLIRIFLSICEPYFIFNNDPWHNAAVTRPAASHVSSHVGSLRPEFPGCSWPWLSQAAAWTRGIVAKCEETIRHRTLVHEVPYSLRKQTSRPFSSACFSDNKAWHPIKLGVKLKLLFSTFQGCPWIWDLALNCPRNARKCDSNKNVTVTLQ